MPARRGTRVFPVTVVGCGAVSAAGIGADAVYRAVAGELRLKVQAMGREKDGGEGDYPCRKVDAAALREALPKHGRLRRASDLTKFAVTAAKEAMSGVAEGRRIGIVMTLLNGCVNYSNRFFTEVVENPAFASPILFPETVFNAPASHVAAYLGCEGPVSTMLGDSATWFSGIELGAEWIADGLVDGCLVICAEELDWLVMEGLKMYSRNIVATEGAAAVYLEGGGEGISLEDLHGPFPYHEKAGRRKAMELAWNHLGDAGDVLVDGLSGVPRVDRDELAVTSQWDGRRLSPTTALGEGMGVRCGLQMVIAVEALRAGCRSVGILAGGGNQHAFSARLTAMIR